MTVQRVCVSLLSCYVTTGWSSVAEVGETGESSGESWVIRLVVSLKARSVKGVGSRLTINNKGGMCNIQWSRVRHAMDKCFVEA